VRGLPNKQAADVLGVTEITVKVQRARIMKKMEAPSLPDLVRMADLLQRSDDGGTPRP
jgi:FixJ family two-component response regulator